MKHLRIAGALLLLVCCLAGLTGCGQGTPPEPTATPVPTETPVPTPSPVPTASPEPTPVTTQVQFYYQKGDNPKLIMRATGLVSEAGELLSLSQLQMEYSTSSPNADGSTHTKTEQKMGYNVAVDAGKIDTTLGSGETAATFQASYDGGAIQGTLLYNDREYPVEMQPQ